MNGREGAATITHTAGGQLGVRVVRTEADFAAMLELRRRVFDDEQRIVDAGVTDPEDERAFHALAALPVEGEALPVGTGRLLLNAGRQGEAQIAWVATLPEWRGRGIGSAVMRFLLVAADEAGASLVVLSAQTHALDFYHRLGFRPYGHRFMIRGIEHQWMARPRPGW